MPVGMFRSEEGWVQVDYGTGNIPIPRSKYEENGYKKMMPLKARSVPHDNGAMPVTVTITAAASRALA